MADEVIFRNIGGGFQFLVEKPEELSRILDLDPAVWAALYAPVSAMNGNRRFLNYLDSDNNGNIRADEVKQAIRTLQSYVTTLGCLDGQNSLLPLDMLNSATLEGTRLREFVESCNGDLLSDNQLDGDKIAARITELTSGPLKGDGIITQAAVSDTKGEDLFSEVCLYTGKNGGITNDDLTKFLSDAKAFLEWAKVTKRPEFRSQDPTLYFPIYNTLKIKIDEYFRFCALIALDPVNAERFSLKSGALPELNLLDDGAVTAMLANAPIAKPGNRDFLPLSGDDVNPFYRRELANFAQIFAVDKLSREDWRAIRGDFQPYEKYLGMASGDTIGALGKDKLSELVHSSGVKVLHGLFVKDGELGVTLTRLRELDLIVLAKLYILDFVNNFVSFAALFSPSEQSLLQAGTLFMDGRAFSLCVWIDNIAAHKKIAMQSMLCILYLELNPPKGKENRKYAAVAVTGGDLARIYIDKPVFFVDMDNASYSGKIADIVDGPISFAQALWGPFRRLGGALSDKLQKLTDFSNVEKQLSGDINNFGGSGTTPATPPAASAGKGGFWGNGSMFLLAGGISVAAIGAAFSYLAKTCASIIENVSAAAWWKIILWIVVIPLIFLIPASINAIMKMRKRNLTLFLEAAGWSVNLPMRLNAAVSRFFTRFGVYPAGATFEKMKLPLPAGTLPGSRLKIFYWLLPLILLLAAGCAALLVYFKIL